MNLSWTHTMNIIRNAGYSRPRPEFNPQTKEYKITALTSRRGVRVIVGMGKTSERARSDALNYIHDEYKAQQ